MRIAMLSATRLNTDRPIRMAMKMEQIGSAMNHPNRCIRIELMITPT